MRFAVTVKAIMSLNLNAFCLTGDPDAIYRFLTAELLECEPADLLLLHELLKRELTNETDTSSSGLNALTKRFFSGLRDVIYGILAERIHEFKDANDFLPLGWILAHALHTDPNVFHEVSHLVYQDNYGLKIIDRAKETKMNKYHDEIAEHFLKTCEQAQNEANNDDDALDANSGEVPSAIAEIRMVHLIDVVTCYIDVIP